MENRKIHDITGAQESSPWLGRFKEEELSWNLGSGYVYFDKICVLGRGKSVNQGMTVEGFREVARHWIPNRV